MKKPYERENASLSNIGVYKGVVIHDDRRTALHHYHDLGYLDGDGE